MRKFIGMSILVALVSTQSIFAGPIRRLFGMQESPEDQLSKVAKDWTGTIRTLKIIPVFPLREDINPGDVFLVNSTAEDEANEFKEQGFLAPDVPMTRLLDIDYQKFYGNQFLSDEFVQMPHSRNSESSTGKIDNLPTVAFPSFTFKSIKNTSLASAFPIQGIPIALGHLGAKTVSGSISISNARSYGADASALFRKLREWAQDESNKEMLKANFAAAGGQPVYLRIVTQVYLAGGVNVSLDSKSTSGTSGAAANPPSSGQATTSGTVEQNNSDVLKSLNSEAGSISSLAQTGGKITFTRATSSTVEVVELFARRQVVGYLGLDVAIGPNGTLGAQRSTSDKLLRSTKKQSSNAAQSSSPSTQRGRKK